MRRQIQLADGRVLEAWIDPDASGVPFVFHVGTPSSGLPFAAHLSAARQRGLRWIGWSRPGYGSSTRLQGRSIASVVEDTRTLAHSIASAMSCEITFNFSGPDVRATFEWIRIDGGLAVRWRRLGVLTSGWLLATNRPNSVDGVAK